MGADWNRENPNRAPEREAAGEKTVLSPAGGYRGNAPTLPADGEDGDLPDPDPLETGTVLSQRFVIKRFIGRGGMGEVYEAEDLQLEHARVALKTIRSDQLWRGNVRQRFRQEVLMARSITHPNVCPVYEMFSALGPDGEISYLTMKLLSGETLAERLHRMAPMRADEVLRFGREIASALDCAHQNGIIHRDLKPSNIILELHLSGVRAVVTDFGLARNWSEQAWSMDGGRVVGTPAYIAPELLDGNVASPRSDVYSFGVVLHEMLLGTRPDAASTPEAETPGVDARARQLEASIHRCLHSKPELRYGSAGEAMDALEAAWVRTSPFFTRRKLIVGSAAVLLGGAVAEFGVREGMDLESWLDPLPRPRRVAILPETESAGRLEDASLVNGVLERVAAELSRAETTEHDLFVVQPKVLREQKVEGAAAALGLFGTNLVLSATLSRGEGVALEMRVLASATGRVLRNARISCTLASLYDLPRMAIERAARLLEVRPKNLSGANVMGDTRNAEAFAAFERGREWLRQYGLPNVEKAIAELQKAVELDPDFARAYAVLAEAYTKRYHLAREPEALDLAERNCQRALKIQPDLPLGYSRKAMIERERGEYEAAIRNLEHASRLDVDDVETQLALAHVYAESGKPRLADAKFVAILDQRPNNWNALNDWADICMSRAEYARAVGLLRQATISAPQASLAWRNLGAAFLEIGNMNDAESSLRRSIGLLPTGEAYTNLGTAYFWRGDYAASADAYRRATLLNPRKAVLWANLGDALARMRGTTGEAKEAWGRAAELATREAATNPKNAVVLTDLALYQAKLGHGAEALVTLARAVRLQPPGPDELFKGVLVHELAGDRDTALRLLAQCLQTGYSAADILHSPELEALRRDRRFKRLGVRA